MPDIVRDALLWTGAAVASTAIVLGLFAVAVLAVAAVIT